MPDFSHEALLYEGTDGFLAGTLPFVREGLERGEPILVAVGAQKLARLREALGADAGRVRFEDMAVLGHNPARIIPAWHDFLARQHRPGGGIRGIGEPIWAGRSATELVECQLHESLLNVAFAGVRGFRLLCPYDVTALDAGIVHEACCSHPVLVEGVEPRPSRAYRVAEELLAPFQSPLPPPPAQARLLGFELDTLADVRRLTEHSAARAGLELSRAQDLVLAVGELAANSIRHGGGRGILRIWQDGGTLVCEVRDRGRIGDPLAGRHAPGIEQLNGRGLWIANSVCDLVQVRSGRQGTAVRVHMAVNPTIS
jgi:anti-sigma regulatory factor (Ser/Thr protein kinase)